jgi:hypothetical protein
MPMENTLKEISNRIKSKILKKMKLKYKKNKIIFFKKIYNYLESLNLKNNLKI